MITSVVEYLNLPISDRPTQCQECGGEFNDQVVCYQLYGGTFYALCPECAEKIGFYLWADGILGRTKSKGGSS